MWADLSLQYVKCFVSALEKPHHIILILIQA